MRNQNGGVLPFLLIISATIGIVTAGLVGFVGSYSKTGFGTQDLLAKRLVLNGLMDYTMIALKQRWCFTPAMQREAAAECDLFHPRNAERLFFRNTSVAVLRELGVTLPDPVVLSEIATTVQYGEITKWHPFHVMSDLLIRSQFQEAEFKIRRVENNVIASQGSETYIKVMISIVDKSGKKSSVESLAAFFPREVGSFALIANKLDLSINSNQPPMVRGTARIPTANKTYKGIQFDSPVFVNRDINLPRGSYSSDLATSYSPVTFMAPVFLGNGQLMEKSQPLDPSPDGDDLMPIYAESKAFGGFKGGIQIDGQLDRGLSVLVGESPSTAVDLGLADTCILRNNYLSNLRESRESELVLKQLSNSGPGSSSEAIYRLGLTEYNEFKEIGDAKRLYTLDRNDEVSESRLLQAGSGKGIIEVELEFDNDTKTEFRLARGSVFRVKTGKSARDKQRKYERDLADTQAANSGFLGLADKKSDYKKLDDEIDALKRVDTDDMSDDEEDAHEDLIDKKEDDLKDLKKEIRKITRDLTGNSYISDYDLNKRLEDAREKIDDLEKKIDKQKAAVANPPEILVELKKVEVEGGTQKGLADLKITMTNSQNFFAPPKISLEGYDVAYETERWSGRIRSQRRGWTDSRGHSTRGELETKADGTGNLAVDQLTTANKWFSADPDYRDRRTVKDPPLEDKNLHIACEGNSENNMLPHASWEVDFSPYSLHSWSFTSRHNENVNVAFTGSNSRSPSNVNFHVRSLMNRCRVSSSANFLVGFFHCKEFVIEQRTTPLTIIGTVIAHTMTVHRSALKEGIRWSSIYNPLSIEQMRSSNVGILKPHSSIPSPYNTCVPSTTIPTWHPSPSAYFLAARYGCNSSSLRAKADPFNWTTVEPDCAKIDSSPGTKCKRHIKRFTVKEYGRSLSL